jgi:protein-S-isoprenylcysteine O-methyltransferase Ste14
MKERKGEHPFGDEGQLISLVLFLIVWISDSFFLHITTGLSIWLPLSIRLVIAGLLMLIAFGLFRTSHFIVSQEERPDYVVKDGAFRYVRHPMYLASLIVFLAFSISTLSLASLVLGMAIFGFYNYIAAYEEQLLEHKFGEAYLAYKRQTGRWLPRVP